MPISKMIKKNFLANQPYHPLSTLDSSLGSFRVGIWLIGLVLFLSLFVFSFSLGLAAQDDGVYTYVFHLYFDNGKLAADRDFQIPFELIAEKYEGSGKVNNTFYGEILSVSNKKLADFSLDLPYGSKGKLSARAPYFDNAKTANFYNRENIRIFSLDLAPSGPVCNENNICNAETGETYLNCANDCRAPNPSITPMPMPIGESDFSFWDIFAPYLFMGGPIILAILLIIWRFKKKKNMPPPQITPQI